MSPAARAFWLRTAAAIFVGCVALKLLGWGSTPVEVVTEIRSEAGTDGEVFYAGPGEQHAPDRRVPFVLDPDGQWHTYRIAVPRDSGIDRLRIDPGSGAGVVEIRSIAVEVAGNPVRLEGDALASAQVGINMLTSDPGETAHMRFNAIAPDPYVDFKLPDGAGVPSVPGRILPWIKAVIISGLLWLAIGEFMRAAILRARPRLPRVFGRVADCASDPGILVVPAPAVAVVLVTVCCAVLYVSLNLHQSSIGVWESLFAATPIEQSVDLGSPRQIRSDEWNTQTPWALNQVIRGNDASNVSVGGEDAPLLASVPVLHSSAIAQAKFFGFYLFDVETGFSWWWAYKSFALLLSFFWLFLLLTRGDTTASALGAIWVYGSSYTQWWFSSSLPELLTAFGLATIGGIYLLFAQRRLMVAIGGLLIAYAVLNLLLHLYPPFILPLAYLGAAILLGMVLEPGRMRLVTHNPGWRVLCLAGSLAIVGVIGGNYLIDAMPSIQVMTDTVYPGRRVATSGDLGVARMMYGFFEVFRIGEDRLPLPPTNASEASSFVILAPLLLLAVPFLAFFRRRNALLTALVLYGIMVAVWTCTRLPYPIERLMQLAGWAWAPPIRAVVGLGIGSIIAVMVLFSRIRHAELDVRPPVVRWLIPVVVLVAVATFGWSLRGLDPAFFGPAVIAVASVAAASAAAGVVLGRITLLVAGLAVFLLPAMMVNPLVSGLSSLNEKPVLVAAKQQSTIGSDRWAVIGAFVLSQGLKSQGLEVITGSQMIPNHGMAEVLDPAGEFEGIWNRYAHVMLRSEPDTQVPGYELLSPDLYAIGINVCGPQLRELGVTRVAYTQPVPPADRACLEALDAPVGSGVQLFRLLPD